MHHINLLDTSTRATYRYKETMKDLAYRIGFLSKLSIFFPLGFRINTKWKKGKKAKAKPSTFFPIHPYLHRISSNSIYFAEIKNKHVEGKERHIFCFDKLDPNTVTRPSNFEVHPHVWEPKYSELVWDKCCSSKTGELCIMYIRWWEITSATLGVGCMAPVLLFGFSRRGLWFFVPCALKTVSFWYILSIRFSCSGNSVPGITERRVPHEGKYLDGSARAISGTVFLWRPPNGNNHNFVFQMVPGTKRWVSVPVETLFTYQTTTTYMSNVSEEKRIDGSMAWCEKISYTRVEGTPQTGWIEHACAS